ncbi:hypothetical protein D3C85_1030360 [compost metagenome]
MSWRRPSKSSARLTWPAGPSKVYVLSTAIHGMRRRSAASASRARVWAFSFTSSCWRAASQASGDTTGGVFMSLLDVVMVRNLLCVLCVLCGAIPA